MCARKSSVFSGGFRGGEGLAPPPGYPNSFDFIQFSGKFGKIVCWRPPPLGVGAPLGKSWIRRWFYTCCCRHRYIIELISFL